MKWDLNMNLYPQVLNTINIIKLQKSNNNNAKFRRKVYGFY